MFPVKFAFDAVQQYCPEGGAVLDPFAGRGSSIYAAATTGRYGYGIEINKVGWLYSKVKLSPAPLEGLLSRICEIEILAKELPDTELEQLPEFFNWCFTKSVLKFLITAQKSLKWQDNIVDATLMALILVDLHGNRHRSFSNQMRQVKAMAQEYSINWWKANESYPPDIDPAHLLRKKVDWRYKKGVPQNTGRGHIQLGDSIKHLDDVIQGVEKGTIPQFDLLLTSPPYYSVTSYYYDQWLRLWMLGEPHTPTKSGGEWQGTFSSKASYETLLRQVFSKVAQVMKDDSTIFVRTDNRQFTRQITLTILKEVFPNKSILESESTPEISQTALYGDKSPKPGEVDIILK